MNKNKKHNVILLLVLGATIGLVYFGTSYSQPVHQLREGASWSEHEEGSAEWVGWPIQYERLSSGICLCDDGSYTDRETDNVRLALNVSVLLTPLILTLLFIQIAKNNQKQASKKKRRK